MWKKHPKTLPFLFFSEMWKRFGYYLMIGIFTLYLKDVKHGYAMTEAESADLYGTFIALVFFNAFHWRFTGRPVFRLSQIHYHGWLNDGNRGLSIVSKLSPVRITSLMIGDGSRLLLSAINYLEFLQRCGITIIIRLVFSG